MRQPPFYIGDEIEITLGDDRRADARRRSSRARSSRSSPSSPPHAAMICRARLRQVAPAAPQPPQRDVPGHDAVGHRPEGRSASAGSRSGTIDSTSTVHTFLQQSMETDLDFLQPARRAGELRVRRRRGQGVPAQAAATAAGTTPELAWRENAISFKPRMTAAQQHDTVARRELRPGDARPPSSARPPRRASSRRSAQQARDKAPGVRRRRAARRRPRRQHRRRGEDDRAEHARHARQRLVRGRGRRCRATPTSRPAARSSSRASARVRRRARRHARSRTSTAHGDFRTRVRDQRPQPAHADRRDAPEGRARLGRRPRRSGSSRTSTTRTRSGACA